MLQNNQLKYAHMDAPQILPTALPLLNMHGQRGTLMNTDLLFRSIDGSGVPNKRKCERLMAAVACDALSSSNGKKLKWSDMEVDAKMRISADCINCMGKATNSTSVR